MKRKPDSILDEPGHSECKHWECHGFPVESVTIQTTAASQRLNKEPGKYITVFTGMLNRLQSTQEAGECLVELLTPLLAPYHNKRVCVCGLGNPELPHDSLGPATVKNIPARFLELLDKDETRHFEKLTTFIPNVIWYTNIQTSDVITGVVSASKTDCLVVIDSSVSTHFESLCKTIQISTAGGTTRYAGKNTIDWDMVGIPVITIGVPTVIALQHLKPSVGIPDEALKEEMFSTSYLQDVIEFSSSIIAYALIRISYPSFTRQQCLEVLGLRRPGSYIW